MMRRRWGLLIGAAGALSIGVACYAPTEVRLEITTDIACPGDPTKASHAGIYVGEQFETAGSVAENDPCGPGSRPNDVGSLVIVPRAARDAHVTVEVALGVNGVSAASCHPVKPTDPIGPNCIVARRSFAFISHTSRTLPIRLTKDCLGRTCADPGDTCIDGRCHPLNVDDPTYCPSVDCAPDSGKPTLGGDAATDGPATDAAPGAAACVADDKTDVLAGGVPTDVLAASSKELFWAETTAAGGIVRYVGNRGGTVNTIVLDPNATPPLTALAVVDDAFLLAGGAGVLYRWDLVGQKLARKLVVAGTVTKIVVIANAQYFTNNPSPTLQSPRIFQINGDAIDLFPSSIGGDDLAISPSGGGAYAIRRDGLGIHRHVPISGTESQLDTTKTTSVAAIDGRVFFSTPGGVSTFGGANMAAGIYGIADGSGAPQTTTLVSGAENLVAAVAPLTLNPPKNPPLPGLYFVVGTKGASAVYRVPFVVGAPLSMNPEKLTPTFSAIQGLVVDSSCIYFWGTRSGSTAAKLNIFPRPLTAANL